MIKLLLTATFIAVANAAHADPCKAIPDEGPAPADLRPGAVFEGRVVYVGDGDSLCVAKGVSNAQWVEVRLEDFYAPELREAEGQRAKDALTRIAFGRRLSCRAGRQSYDRVVASCTLNGIPVGDLMRKAGVPEGGRAHRR
jgi:endonuclease YncB( thermonuclease family)